MSASSDIEGFILRELTQGSGITTIGPQDNLLTTGIVDSHGVTELVAFLEDRYGIEIGDADLTPENFESVASIDAFVTRKRDGHA